MTGLHHHFLQRQIRENDIIIIFVFPLQYNTQFVCLCSSYLRCWLVCRRITRSTRLRWVCLPSSSTRCWWETLPSASTAPSVSVLRSLPRRRWVGKTIQLGMYLPVCSEFTNMLSVWAMIGLGLGVSADTWHSKDLLTMIRYKPQNTFFCIFLTKTNGIFLYVSFDCLPCCKKLHTEMKIQKSLFVLLAPRHWQKWPCPVMEWCFHGVNAPYRISSL